MTRLKIRAVKGSLHSCILEEGTALSIMTHVNRFRQLYRKYVPIESLRERFAKGMMWVVAGSSVRQGVNFVAGILLARMLGIADFGKLAVLQSTVMMLTGFGQAGIGLSSTKYVASLRSSDPRRAGRVIGFALIFVGAVSLVMVMAIALFSRSISPWIVPSAEISIELQISCGWLAFELINIVQLSLLAGLESFNRSAYINLFQAVFLLPAIFIGAHFFGLSGTVLAYSSISLMGCFFGHYYMKKACAGFDIKISYRDTWQERSILRMSTMVWLSGIAMNATNWLVGIMLARQPSGLYEFALFSAAQRLQNIVIFIPTRVYQVSVPILSNLLAIGDKRGFQKTLLGASAIAVGITTVGVIPICLYSDVLMRWYGSTFQHGSVVLEIVAVSTIVSSFWTIASAGLWAAEQSQKMFMLDIFRGVLLIMLCVGGMAAGAQNLAIAYLVSYSAGLAMLIMVLFRYLKTFSKTEKSVESPN